jgi:PLD-like domain
MSDSGISDDVRAKFEPVLAALPSARKALADVQDVVAVRPGFFRPASGDPVPAVVVAVTPGTTPVNATDLAHRLGVPFAVADATVEEQMAAASAPESDSFAPREASVFEALLTGAEVPTDFAPPRSGAYEPLDPSALTLVNEKMKLTICVSPEAGWGELKDFLAGTQECLTIGMYQFTAPHIFEAVRNAVQEPGRQLDLVLHPVPEPPSKSGTKANDLREKEEVLSAFRKLLKDRFRFSWATLASKAHPDGLWASAYHIKVCVRDGTAVWVSSGNWQSSNQPPLRPFATPPDRLPPGFQRKYNRDYHAIIENEKLAAIYEKYLKRDLELASAQGEPQAFTLPDLFVEDVEEEAVEFAQPPQFFKPLRIDRKVKVQPLLTPDNYIENVLPLIRSAKKSVWFQNQYINFRGDGEDFPDFKLLVDALKAQIDAGRDVRIICRDMMKQESVDVLTAIGFPREVMRFQPACHNKTIIIDSKTVMFGSQNWSNEGVKPNRDASLIFFDPEIAQYLAGVFEYDWNRLATAKPTPPRIRVAKQGERTPAGFSRVPFSSVFED